MNTPLSQKENELKTLLLNADIAGMWFKDVRTILNEGLNWKIRRLFAELKSQQIDNPPAMVQSIGPVAADKLEKL